MTHVEFEQYLAEKKIPTDAPPLLKALLFDAFGDWEAAHDVAQSQEGTAHYDRLHAYLHRKEGDEWNAQYWYRRIKIAMPTHSLAEEWRFLVDLFLKETA